MAYEAKVLKHSISERGVELITFEVNYPHAVHKDACAAAALILRPA